MKIGEDVKNALSLKIGDAELGNPDNGLFNGTA